MRRRRKGPWQNEPIPLSRKLAVVVCVRHFCDNLLRRRRQYDPQMTTTGRDTNTTRSTMRAVNILLSVIVVTIVAAGAGTYRQIKSLSTAVNQLRQDESARGAAFGSAIAPFQKENVG